MYRDPLSVFPIGYDLLVLSTPLHFPAENNLPFFGCVSLLINQFDPPAEDRDPGRVR